MTQQPYYPQQQYPQAPQSYQNPPVQQPYGQQPQVPQFPQQGYQAPPQTPAGPPPAQGTLDAFYSQPTSASGPSIAWSVNGQQKPLGTSYAGIVARDIIDADVQQDSDPKTGQLKTYRDGRPKFFMKVPLKVQASPEFPEGEATWYVRGQSREELARAMGEAGVSGSPKGGDAIRITLVDRRPSRGGGMPANIVQVQYQPANPGQGTVPAAAAPAPAQPTQAEQQFQQPQAPVPAQSVPQGAPQFAQPAAQQPVPQGAPAVPQQQAQQPSMPADLSPDQQALLARLTGGGQA